VAGEKEEWLCSMHQIKHSQRECSEFLAIRIKETFEKTVENLLISWIITLFPSG
jgi:hypothetical protein